MKLLIALLALLPLSAQQATRWGATTGDVVLAGAATTATIQQPATNAGPLLIDQIAVYCSAACTFTQTANGTAATSTAGTVTPILPSQLSITPNLTMWTASNVGTGTAQGGITRVPAGGTVMVCLSPTCGAAAQVQLNQGQGTAANYSVVIASVTATVNITFFGRSQ